MFSSHHTPRSGAIAVMLYVGVFCWGFSADFISRKAAAQVSPSIQPLKKPLEVTPTIQYLKKPTVCPAEFSQLSQALTADLKDYLNRTYARNKIKRQVVAISFPELQPLPIANSLNSTPDSTKQFFFSVRSRTPGSLVTSDTAYWLFLVETKNGWRLAMAFQRVGNATPEDVSYGAIANATSTWLRDNCDQTIK
jgi:hypothetical protein